MSVTTKILKIGGVALGGVVLLVGGGSLWASSAASTLLSRRIETHSVEISIPALLSPDEVEALRAERAAAALEGSMPAAPEEGAALSDPLAGVDLDEIARERAISRGQHLVEARYGCTSCHGQGLGGGVMLDDPMVGHFFGPNLTTGRGGRTANYTSPDWDRIVRHGVKPDGTPAVMPAADNFGMTDQELGDIVTYIRSLPPVDNEVEASTLGPVGRILVATGQLPAAADLLADHHAPHAAVPPPSEATMEFGAHLLRPCGACHRADFSGGPVVGGDPSWPPAANLTPGPDGLAGWTYDDFVVAMVEGRRKDGTLLGAPMSEMTKFAAKTTEVERQAMWLYLQSMPPRPDGA